MNVSRGLATGIIDWYRQMKREELKVSVILVYCYNCYCVRTFSTPKLATDRSCIYGFMRWAYPSTLRE